MADMKAKIKGVSLNGKPLGIDLWIQNCQFVAEPSVNRTNNLQYKWIVPLNSRDDIPDLPEWIYDLYHSGKINEDCQIIQEDPVSTIPEYELRRIREIPNDASSERSFASTASMSITSHQDASFVSSEPSSDSNVPLVSMIIMAFVILLMSTILIVALTIVYIFGNLISAALPPTQRNMFKQFLIPFIVAIRKIFD